MGQTITAENLHGYEIHMGYTRFSGNQQHPFVIEMRGRNVCESAEGAAGLDGRVFGTYIHGIFDNDAFRRSLLNALRLNKGLQPVANTRNVMAEKQQAYEHLADVVEKSLDMEKLYQIMGEKLC